ncbi:MAG: peptide chain release factor 2 [Firmicutes bacterium]|nr:peptide chain release factor 2 [Bacillota bacterium]
MLKLEQLRQDLPQQLAKLREAGESLDLAGLRKNIEELSRESEAPDFWNDQEKAQGVLKKKKSMERTVEEYDRIYSELSDMPDLMDIAEELDDEAEADAILENYEKVSKDLESFRLTALLDGKYDHNSAILTVHAGAGGVEAMDWAQMLQRMYIRWAEKKGYKVNVVDQQDDVEAGIKSATMMIEGDNAYGYLRRENGVHRLVRISPFNAAGKRQTSFASVEVMPEIDDEITVEIDPNDLRIDTYRSSGAGGQHVNTTDSAIRITHIPTNIVVTCQNERSQFQNRDVAMRILIAKLTELAEREHKENLKELKGDFSQIAWGSQIRSYVFQPYTLVKDHRTNAEVGNVQGVMDGDLDYLINEELKAKI